MSSPDKSLTADVQYPRLYSELAAWWPLLSAPEEYAEEAAFYRKAIFAACSTPPHTMLELGSGGGNNASHLKQHFRITLVDRSLDMLEVSRALNPECEHIEGDMRSVRMGRSFDVVFIHDAIMYLTRDEDLRKAIETAFAHCKPGGVALFAPDWVRETFRPSTDHGGHDGPGRGLRYLEWTYDPDPANSTYFSDMVYVLRDAGGAVRVEYDRHIAGLFGFEEWIRFIKKAGFQAQAIPLEHSEVEPGSTYVFLGVKPNAAK